MSSTILEERVLVTLRVGEDSEVVSKVIYQIDIIGPRLSIRVGSEVSSTAILVDDKPSALCVHKDEFILWDFSHKSFDVGPVALLIDGVLSSVRFISVYEIHVSTSVSEELILDISLCHVTLSDDILVDPDSLSC